MKPVFSHLRGKGHISSGYIDDSFLVGYSNSECQLNVDDTLQCFHELGFLTHDDKSVTTPTQIIQHLGFVLNSIEMTISISEKNTINRIISVLKQNMPSIRAVAQMIGMMVVCCPGLEYGPLFYRQIDIGKKTAALKANQGDFDKHMTLSPKAHQDMLWWVENARLFK